MTQKHNKNRILGMRARMFIYLTVFVLVLILIIALFQTFLLPTIYRFTVKNQTITATNSISRLSFDSEETYKTQVYDVASRYRLCISVYRVKTGRAIELVNAHNLKLCMIHGAFIDESLISALYDEALSNDIYVYENRIENSSTEGSFLASKLISGENESILIIANSEIQPIDTTVETLRFELIIVSIILIAVALIGATFISKKITAPVSQMNEEAKKLAKGNYDVNFNGGEFRETAELGSTLNYAAEELSNLDSMQKELISNISHDLRTPLTLISGYSEVMRDLPGEMNKENIQVIIDESARLSSLVNDMLDLSRITNGKREIKKTVFSLTEAVKKTVDRYSHLISKDNYSITFNFEREVFVEADETLVLQVIYNLINNAVNYTGEDKKVIISQSLNENICRISVTDTGDGIEEEKLPLIWDRYYRTGDYHKRAVTGTGLGLSIVKNALVLHGADFGVSTEKGKGSTFWFELSIIEKGETK